MTIDLTHVSGRTPSGARPAGLDALRALPPRRPAAPAPRCARLQWSLIDLERYEVTVSGETIGFIDVVGAVYVALGGSRADLAVEVAQSLVFEEALAALEAHGGRPGSRL